MNKFGTIIRKRIVAAQLLTVTLLAACAATPSSTSVCHATGDPVNPYQEVTVTDTELVQHLEHPNDINPVPPSGCPAYPVAIESGEITFCHANGSETDPYDEVTVNANGLSGHGEHEGDIFMVSDEEGCPAGPVVVGDKITICHATSSEKNPYNLITVSVNGLNGHDKHDGDIIPAPADGCPTTRP